jgi:hypothetical protein
MNNRSRVIWGVDAAKTQDINEKRFADMWASLETFYEKTHTSGVVTRFSSRRDLSPADVTTAHERLGRARTEHSLVWRTHLLV